jgi:hypothetical protein
MRRVSAFLVLMCLWSDAAGACFLGPPIPELLVARAAVIVVAVARRPETPPAWPAPPLIEFHVQSVLRGNGRLEPEYIPSPLLIEGTLTQRDDFNDRPSPYDFVRPTGRYGTCFTREYREGARYLLLLNKSATGALTPYWAPLAPTNEQLHPGDDPWLVAVRRFATAAPAR